jgi:hypothetical protein
MQVLIHFRGEVFATESDIDVSRRNIESAKSRKVFCQFKNDKGFLTWINPDLITHIEATEEVIPVKVVVPEVKKPVKETYTEEQLEVQPLLAAGYGGRVAKADLFDNQRS